MNNWFGRDDDRPLIYAEIENALGAISHLLVLDPPAFLGWLAAAFTRGSRVSGERHVSTRHRIVRAAFQNASRKSLSVARGCIVENISRDSIPNRHISTPGLRPRHYYDDISANGCHLVQTLYRAFETVLLEPLIFERTD